MNKLSGYYNSYVHWWGLSWGSKGGNEGEGFFFQILNEMQNDRCREWRRRKSLRNSPARNPSEQEWCWRLQSHGREACCECLWGVEGHERESEETYAETPLLALGGSSSTKPSRSVRALELVQVQTEMRRNLLLASGFVREVGMAT